VSAQGAGQQSVSVEINKKKVNLLLYKKMLILLIVVAAMFAAFRFQQYLIIQIKPARSIQHFLLYFFISAIVIFAMVFITGFTIIYFKDFFFKK
jgi:hypothetical protein